MNRSELLHDLGAVSLIFHHAPDAVDLAPSTSESMQEVPLRGVADAHRVGRPVGVFCRHDPRYLILYPSIVYLPRELVKRVRISADMSIVIPLKQEKQMVATDWHRPVPDAKR